MCSMSRARAASSPPPQAFNRFVISAECTGMDGPFSRGIKKYTRNVAGFGWPLPTVQADEIKSLPKTGGTDEILRYFGADAHSRSRKRVRTTDSGKRKHVVFWKWRGQRDRSKATQLKHRRRKCCRQGYVGPVHISRYQGRCDFSGSVQHLLGRVFSSCGRRGRASISRWKSVEGQSRARIWLRRLHRFRAYDGPLYFDL